MDKWVWLIAYLWLVPDYVHVELLNKSLPRIVFILYQDYIQFTFFCIFYNFNIK